MSVPTHHLCLPSIGDDKVESAIEFLIFFRHLDASSVVIVKVANVKGIGSVHFTSRRNKGRLELRGERKGGKEGGREGGGRRERETR